MFLRQRRVLQARGDTNDLLRKAAEWFLGPAIALNAIDMFLIVCRVILDMPLSLCRVLIDMFFDTDKRERGKWRGFGCMCGCGWRWRGYTMIYSTVNQVSGLDTCAYLHVYVFQRRYPNCHLNIDGLGNDNSRESADQCGNYAINECMDRSLCLVCSPIFRLLFPYAPVPSSLPFFFVLFLLLLLVILHLHLFLPSPLSSWSPFSPSFGLLSCTPLSSIVTVRTTTVFFFFPFSVSFSFSHSTITTTTSSSLHLLRVTFFYFVDFLLLIFSLYFSSYSFLEMRKKLSRFHSGCPTLLIL